MIQLPFRQVHLDFHTSEHMPDVGKKFNKKQWQAALKAGAVNSITVFAKGHHSWSYYPTKAGMKHPTLKKDLLGLQIKACHEIGVRAPIYFTVGWSATDAEEVVRLAPLGEKIRGNLGLVYPIVNGPWQELCAPGETVPPTRRAIGWVQANPAVSSVLVAFASVAELEEGVGAA